jgi:hypothetical protein
MLKNRIIANRGGYSHLGMYLGTHYIHTIHTIHTNYPSY